MESYSRKIENYDKDFYNNLQKLRQILIILSRKDKDERKNDLPEQIPDEKERNDILDETSNTASENKCVVQQSKAQLLEKINKVFRDFISCKDDKKTLAVPDRKTWKNTNFAKDCGIQLVKDPAFRTIGRGGSASNKRLILLQHLLTKIYKLIETDSYKTKRELFYEDVHLFKSQSIVDELLNDISCLLNASKTNLHVLTTSKGCIAGALRFKDGEGNYMDCAETARGILIPNNVRDISNIQSDARFVLVIEKSAVFEMVIDNGLLSFFHPCILVTGKGFPDVNTREMLRKLFDSLQIPILGLFDADPYGIEILGTYKYGSKAMAFDVKNLAVPEMRWLGVFPTDIERLSLPAESTMPLTENDKKKANHLLSLPYVQHHQLWLHEVEEMLRMEKKAEIEGLSKVSPTFLPSIYLPKKVKHGGWM